MQRCITAKGFAMAASLHTTSQYSCFYNRVACLVAPGVACGCGCACIVSDGPAGPYGTPLYSDRACVGTAAAGLNISRVGLGIGQMNSRRIVAAVQCHMRPFNLLIIPSINSTKFGNLIP